MAEIRALKPTDKLKSFSAGAAAFQPLKTFAERDAQRFEREFLARTYVVEEATPEGGMPRYYGYLTLICSQIETTAPLVGDHYRYTEYPAVKIARLLVDSRVRGRGVGKNLIAFSLGIAKNEISARVGCRFLVVDSKPQSVAFYEKEGFTLLDTPQNRAKKNPLLFIDLLKV